MLFKHRDASQVHLFAQAQVLFGFAPTITLYDLTNTYFEGVCACVAKAKRGHSKVSRCECPLVTLAVALDASGFVRRSKVFAGKASEPATLKDMLTSLNAAAGATVAMDAGIATEANLTRLRENGYHYLVKSRLRERQFDPQDAALWRTYMMLTDLESVFRSLKPNLGLRPLFHQVQRRVEGHLFIRVLAYHLVHTLRTHLKAKGIDDSWATLRETLSDQRRVTVTLPRRDGRTVHVRKASRPEPRHQTINEILGQAPNPGGTQRTVVWRSDAAGLP